jgi:hypothetical protein
MGRSTEPSLPPAEPRPTGSFGSFPGPPSSRRAPDAPPPSDRPARVQLIVALVLGLSLVAIPLYLWRRPQASDAINASNLDGGALAALGGLGAADGGTSGDDGGISALPTTSATMPGSSPVVAECHDKGTKRTASAACDRLPSLEAAVQQAVADVGACFPAGAAGSASTTRPVVATYAVDVSFRRKRNPLQVRMTTDPPSSGTRSQRNACVSRVKAKLAAVSLTGVAHEHERYLITLAAR